MAVVARLPERDDVWLVELEPTMGAEIRKTRPCLVVSPDVMNQYLKTVIVAPMTRTIRGYPTRIGVSFQGKKGEIALDQLRAVDQQRLIRKLGTVSPGTAKSTSARLVEMFEYL